MPNQYPRFQGLGSLAMIWFMAALVMTMRDADVTILAVAAGLSFAVALALGSAATIMRSGIALFDVLKLEEELEPRVPTCPEE